MGKWEERKIIYCPCSEGGGGSPEERKKIVGGGGKLDDKFRSKFGWVVGVGGCVCLFSLPLPSAFWGQFLNVFCEQHKSPSACFFFKKILPFAVIFVKSGVVVSCVFSFLTSFCSDTAPSQHRNKSDDENKNRARRGVPRPRCHLILRLHFFVTCSHYFFNSRDWRLLRLHFHSTQSNTNKKRINSNFILFSATAHSIFPIAINPLP